MNTTPTVLDDLAIASPTLVIAHHDQWTDQGHGPVPMCFTYGGHHEAAGPESS